MQSILTLNLGSSSIKFSVFEIDKNKTLHKHISGMVDNLLRRPIFRAKLLKNKENFIHDWSEDPQKSPHLSRDPYGDAIDFILNWLSNHKVQVIAAGHRVAHGGIRYSKATPVSDEALDYLETLSPLAPLHQPFNLKGIAVLKHHFPDIPQVICFDTAFHTTCEPLSQLFAIPKSFRDKGIRRYGFHGLSYAYIVSQFDHFIPKEKRDGKFIILHLGNGSTMCAVHKRKSVATSIGFSALDGLPMGTRCGSIDAGVILHLIKNYGMDYDALNQLLYKQSGLLGVSEGISSDMRDLESSETTSAELAIDLYCYRINCFIGQLVAELEGLDGLIFTAGIGEHSALVRKKVCEKASWLGAKIDDKKNKVSGPELHQNTNHLLLYAIQTDEESTIAQETFETVLS